MINFSMMVASIQNEIKLHYKYKILYDKTQVVKQKVIEHLFGSHEKTFEKLICLQRCVTGGRTNICIILDRHTSIKIK